ncbi:MAG: hypothetical protein AAF621_06470 [Pseudomonadota bacterium]
MNEEEVGRDADGQVDLVDFANQVKGLVDDCDNYLSQLSNTRQRALEYYNGTMSDLVADTGRSSVVSKDIREEVKKLMPSVMRTLFSNDKIVTYQPVDQESEDQAEQATDYVNYKIVPKCGAEDAIIDALMDAILLKTGILKTVAYTERISKQYKYTGQPENVVIALEADPNNQITDLIASPETDPDVLMIDPQAMLYDFTLKRTEEVVRPCMEAVQRDRFLIYPSAQSIEESPIVGEKEYVTRSDLIERGYDRDKIDDVSEHLDEDITSDRFYREGDDYGSDLQGNRNRSQQLILIFTVYVKYDLNDDGISELYKVVLLDEGTEKYHENAILDIQEVDEVPYFPVKIEREAYQFEGRSLSEDLVDIQRINTSFLRAIIDNTYWQNNQQPVVDYNALTEEGLEAVYNPEFGRPIIAQNGGSESIKFLQVPFIADKVFPIMSYMKEMKKARTGISEASGGLDPETLRQMTATSAGIINEGSLAQSEMMIRTLARGGIKDAFRSLLRLVIQHTDRAQTLKIKGEWVTYDPRVWNSEMNCCVNVGLGAGSKERDLGIMNTVLALQEKLFAAFGADNPFVKPEQVYNVLEKITESAGLPSASPFFTRPDPQEIAAKMEAQRNEPTEADKKLQAQMQMEKYKADRKVDIETAQLVADKDVEEAQMQADIAVEEVRAANRSDLENQRIAANMSMHADKMDLEYKKLQRVN